MLFAYGANTAHGLRRSNADKRGAVAMMPADQGTGRPPTTGGGTPSGGAATRPKVEAPSTGGVGAPSTPTPPAARAPAPTAAEKAAAEAHGDTNMEQIVEELQREQTGAPLHGRAFVSALLEPGLPSAMRKPTSSTTHEWVARDGLRLDLTWNADSVPAQ